MKVVLVGGGHAHVVALRQLAKRADHDIDLHLISPHMATTYSGLLPSYVAGHVDRSAVDICLQAICDHAGANFILGKAVSLDAERRVVVLDTGRSINFDLASLDVGAVAAGLNQITDERVAPIKPMEGFLTAWTAFIRQVETRPEAPRVAVIGAGAGGVELALSIHYRLRRTHNDAETHLFQREADIVPEATPALRNKLRHELASAGVRIHLDAEVDLSNLPVVIPSSSNTFRADFVALTTGAKAHGWLTNTDLTLTDGFIAIDETLRSISHNHVFATGDTAHYIDRPLPKAGIYAVRQGAILAANILAVSRGEPLSAYTPQSDYLKLISLGRKKAIAEKWGFAISAPGLWSLKKAIDLAFTRAD